MKLLGDWNTPLPSESNPTKIPTIIKDVSTLKIIKENIPTDNMDSPKAEIFSLPILSDKCPLTGATIANIIGDTVIISPAELGLKDNTSW